MKNTKFTNYALVQLNMCTKGSFTLGRALALASLKRAIFRSRDQNPISDFDHTFQKTLSSVHAFSVNATQTMID